MQTPPPQVYYKSEGQYAGWPGPIDYNPVSINIILRCDTKQDSLLS